MDDKNNNNGNKKCSYMMDWNADFIDDMCIGCGNDLCEKRDKGKNDENCAGCDYMDWNSSFAVPCAVCKILQDNKQK